MTAALRTPELLLFQDAIAQRLGLRFDDDRLGFLAEVLTRRVTARRSSARAYLSALAAALEPVDELSALSRELTIGETYFFRHAAQFKALADVALPERIGARAGSRRLRLLSAGCASGEEAYSMAILMREKGIAPGLDVTIQGLDLNPDALAKAARGVYSSWSLRELSPEQKRRWFRPEGREHRLDDSLRQSVSFEQHNLILDAPHLLAPGSLDMIFCRNVLMYFTAEHAAAIVARLARALLPGGFLFLGLAETLRGSSQAFQLRHSHGTFFYQLPEDSDRARPNGASSGSLHAESATYAPEDAVPWLDAVAHSTERIRQLADAAQLSETLTSVDPNEPRDLSRALELLGHERFAEALKALDELPATDRPEPAELLLRAALLTHRGALPEAEAACHALLRQDVENAGAHYLLALCCERQGRVEAAAEHDATAAYSDPSFAMPHLHLGLMARRSGDGGAARRSLTRALTLLQAEAPSRLLLFGGGFGREALLELCRSELSRLKDRS